MKTRTEAMRDLTENIFYLIVKIINHAYFIVKIIEENSKSLIHLKKTIYSLNKGKPMHILRSYIGIYIFKCVGDFAAQISIDSCSVYK